MSDEQRSESGLALDGLVDFPAEMGRAHESGERAAEQVAKILTTVHAGLGVTLAAWLQRIFEQAEVGPLSPLAWYLVCALALAMLGIVCVAVAANLDTYSAREFGTSTSINARKVIAYKTLGDPVRRSKILALDTEDAPVRERAERLNWWSHLASNASLLALVMAFGVLVAGIVSTIRHPAPWPVKNEAARVAPPATPLPDSRVTVVQSPSRPALALSPGNDLVTKH